MNFYFLVFPLCFKSNGHKWRILIWYGTWKAESTLAYVNIIGIIGPFTMHFFFEGKSWCGLK